jgi:hypothetical protein
MGAAKLQIVNLAKFVELPQVNGTHVMRRLLWYAVRLQHDRNMSSPRAAVLTSTSIGKFSRSAILMWNRRGADVWARVDRR